MARPLKQTPTPTKTGPLTPELIGQFVRAKRTQSGLRIDDAADLCGVSVETISKIETAKGRVTTTNLFKVLNGLGLKMQMEPWS